MEVYSQDEVRVGGNVAGETAKRKKKTVSIKLLAIANRSPYAKVIFSLPSSVTKVAVMLLAVRLFKSLFSSHTWRCQE